MNNSEINPELTCRLCLERHSKFDLIEFSSESGQSKQLLKKIQEVFHINMTVTKLLPKSICLFCYTKLEDYWSFSKKVLENQLRLRGLESSENDTNEIVVNIKEIEVQQVEDLIYEDQPGDYSADENKTEPRLNTKKFEENSRFFCDHCTKSFTRKTTLLYHIRASHLKTRFVCPKCPKTYKYKTDLNVHLKSTHTNRQKEECPECKSQVLNLKKHIQRHEERRLNIHCDVCDKKIANQRYLKEHKKLMHSDNKLSFGCEICDKTFSSKITLKNHLARHSGIFLYECNFCEKKFRNTGTKSKHVKKWHTKQN